MRRVNKKKTRLSPAEFTFILSASTVVFILFFAALLSKGY